MSTQSVQQLQAGTDVPSPDKKLNLVPRGTKFKTPSLMKSCGCKDGDVCAKCNPVPHTQNQSLHDEAVKIIVEMGATRTESKAKETVKGYNARRKAATAKLKPVLTKIWECFDNGETVGGCTGPKEWCKQVGGITYARCRQIITGKSGNEGKVKSLDLKANNEGKVESLDLAEGVTVTIKGRKYTLTKAMIDAILAAAEKPAPTKRDTDVISTTKVGDKAEPTPHGFYYEFIKDEEPYAVRDVNNPHVGILCKVKSKTEAERYINDRERDAAEAMAAAQEETQQPANQVATDEKPGLPDEPKATVAVVTHAGSGKQTYCGLRSTKKNPLVFVKDEENEAPTCAACVKEMKWEPSEEDLARLKKRVDAADKAKATRLARLPQSEHYRAEDKGFGHWLVIEKSTGYRRDELFSSSRRDCQEHLEAMERFLKQKAECDGNSYEADKIELEMYLEQLAKDADETGPLDDERRAEMVERIRDLEGRVEDYERKHPAKAHAAPVDGATTCDNEVNSNEAV